MPRSGTTWLARLLAQTQGSALAGREPMNPHDGQYALGGTVRTWVRLEEPTAAQIRAMRRAYRATSPRVYSRYGVRQGAAALPWTRLIVKDPFALLSVPAISAATGARTVIIYRHPGAMLSSYRRMGWYPDLGELVPIVDRYRRDQGKDVPVPSPLPRGTDPGSASAMAWFWSSLYAMALGDLKDVDDCVVVSHERLASDPDACRRVHDELGVRWGVAAEAEFARRPTAPSTGRGLHNFDRSPAAAAVEWRSSLSKDEFEEIDGLTNRVRAHLDRIDLGASEARGPGYTP